MIDRRRPVSRKLPIWLAVMGLACASLATSGRADQPTREFFAAPHGRPDGNGSLQNPWDLQTALTPRPDVQPGATIWLRGGTYTGTFVSRLVGREDAYITLRAYRGERVILDNPVTSVSPVPVLTVQGAYVVVWGLEITSSNPNRVAVSGVQGDLRPLGINVFAPHSKIVNNIVHDVGTCLGHWSQAIDSEIYGNLLYFCGWDASRGSGHGMYVQNERGPKEIRDNIIFDGFGFGIHAYTEGGAIDDLHFRGNVSFGSSALTKVTPSGAADILVGGRKVARRPIVEGNFTYRPNGTNWVGYRAGTDGAVVTGNYFVVGPDGVALSVIDPQNATISGNTIVGGVGGVTQYRDNTFEKSPHGVWRFVLANAYDRARATIVVYNWDGADSVTVDAPSWLAKGDTYELRNVQDYFSDVTVRTFDGQPVVVPMHGRTVAVPVGWQAPPSTFPTFGVFVLVKKDAR